jgi:hypothetical protein
MLIYKYSKNMNYKYFINLINFIYDNETEIDNDKFFNQLQIMTFMNKKEIDAF